MPETALIGLRPDQAKGALIVEVVLDAGQARVMAGKATKISWPSRELTYSQYGENTHNCVATLRFDKKCHSGRALRKAATLARHARPRPTRGAGCSTTVIVTSMDFHGHGNDGPDGEACNRYPLATETDSTSRHDTTLKVRGRRGPL